MLNGLAVICNTQLGKYKQVMYKTQVMRKFAKKFHNRKGKENGKKNANKIQKSQKKNLFTKVSINKNFLTRIYSKNRKQCNKL